MNKTLLILLSATGVASLVFLGVSILAKKDSSDSILKILHLEKEVKSQGLKIDSMKIELERIENLK